MKTTAEMKIEVSNARIRNENVNDECILVETSKLSLSDAFMNHKPRTVAEENFKTTLTRLIIIGIDDFYRPAMDPSFANKEKTEIHYKAGKKPAVGKSYNWWEDFLKDSDFCLGTKDQYEAFLGVLIKMLVAEGWTCCEAWDAVCNDSKKLGHYLDSINAKDDDFENTGSREICGFFDLANTYKILAKDKKDTCYYLAGGCCGDEGHWMSLAELGPEYCKDFDEDSGVPWLVLKK